jgi:dynein heavy chain 1
MLGASLEEVQECLEDPDFEERVQRFAGEGGGPLYVVKVKDDVEGAWAYDGVYTLMAR